MFNSDFIQKLEYLALVYRRMFRGRLLVRKRVRQTGGGVEFADHRDYVFGDDLRYLDWNAYARLDSRLIKRFEEEEDLHVYFFLDCSGSMAAEYLESQISKFDYARQITAALAYIALTDLDRVSIISFADRIYDVFPLTRGKQHILSLLRFLESLRCTGGPTDLAASVYEFFHRKQRAGLAVLVSDFYDSAGFQKTGDTLRYRKYEPNLIQIHDPAEANPKLWGNLQLVDIETGASRKVTINETILRRYSEVHNEFLESIQTYCVGNGFGHALCPTSVPFDELVLRMMRQTAMG